MELKIIHWIGIGIGLAIIGISFFFYQTNFFLVMIGGGVLIGSGPFMITLINEARIANEKEEMFIEFARNLVESVKTGTPVSKSIINIKNKDFGRLSENVKKLASQISIGIPMSTALQIFARDVNNKTVSRAVTLIGQAEKAGGDIGQILQSVAGAIAESDKLKKERKAAISTLVVQGYIIFLVFLIIILVMQFKIIPMISGIANVSGAEGAIPVEGIGISGSSESTEDMQRDISNAFLYLLLIQGLFSGLTIGKLSENSIKVGLKHSFALMLISFLTSAIGSLFFGSPAG